AHVGNLFLNVVLKYTMCTEQIRCRAYGAINVGNAAVHTLAVHAVRQAIVWRFAPDIAGCLIRRARGQHHRYDRQGSRHSQTDQHWNPRFRPTREHLDDERPRQLTQTWNVRRRHWRHDTTVGLMDNPRTS